VAISGIASFPSASLNNKYTLCSWRPDKLQTKNFFASFINLDSIINAPAYYPDDLPRGADDWDVASPGTRYLSVNHKLLELLGYIHAQGLKSVPGPTLTDKELSPCLV
jgi:hypothetical protein